MFWLKNNGLKMKVWDLWDQQTMNGSDWEVPSCYLPCTILSTSSVVIDLKTRNLTGGRPRAVKSTALVISNCFSLEKMDCQGY